jgi:hypothetical protein
LDDLIKELVAIYGFSLHPVTLFTLFLIACLALLAIRMATWDICDWIFHWFIAVITLNV